MAEISEFPATDPLAQARALLLSAAYQDAARLLRGRKWGPEHVEKTFQDADGVVFVVAAVTPEGVAQCVQEEGTGVVIVERTRRDEGTTEIVIPPQKPWP